MSGRRQAGEIDARLDLHGFGLEEARRQVEDFVIDSRRNGCRRVLVITGKSGMMRREFSGWLAVPAMNAHVLRIKRAHSAHGGEGAFYVWLRNPSPPSRRQADRAGAKTGP